MNPITDGLACLCALGAAVALAYAFIATAACGETQRPLSNSCSPPPDAPEPHHKVIDCNDPKYVCVWWSYKGWIRCEDKQP